ncbi:MAG: aspartate aminotransferase family protein [SAR324 cluster bacterium]|nr:aspartate aminotransferase family protein [SAR324 cluster bacterium]
MSKRQETNSDSRKAHEDLRAAARRHLIRYGGDFLPPVIAEAKGAYMYDREGRAILDFSSGQMCAILGHGHPAITRALESATREVVHLFSNLLSPAVIELAEALAALLPPSLQKTMFLSTGGEANEAALRLAKLKTGGFEVLAFSSSWHGMTAGAASSTYARGRRGYGPAMPGTLAIPAPNPYRCPVRHCRERCDMTCLEAGMALADQQSVGAYAAFIAEPILSSGGIVELPQAYLERLQALCEERGMLLILDESQTALGRVGSNFAFEHSAAIPHILTLSKTLGAGLPLSATVTSPEIEEECYQKGFLHYTSHVSDPLPARVGLAVLQVVAEERLADRAVEMGAYLKKGLRELMQRHQALGDVRGRGLLLGIELVKDRESREADPELTVRIARRALELGLSLSRVAAGKGSIFRIAPPLTITREEIDSGLEILDQTLRECSD